MNKKFLILKLLESKPLELATIRSLLHSESLQYIEIDNTFVVSCYVSSSRKLSDSMQAYGIKFILIYVNNKAGAAVFASGIGENDQAAITRIVENI